MEIAKNLITEPKISIIITYYNFAKYIKSCIESIFNQTYQNFEIIIVNDGSNEENSKILSEFKDEKIRIIHLKENSGQFMAFLEGIKEAKSEFICMVDADDILLPNYLKTLLYVHLNNNVALVSSSKGEINENNEIISLNKSVNNAKINYSEIENLFKDEQYFKVTNVKAPFGLWSWNSSSSAMFRKSAVEILKYYPDKAFWKTGADKVIFSFLHLIGGSINISAVCYLYRIHALNNFNTSKNTGNTRYFNQISIKKLILWNKKLRFDAIKMFFMYRHEIAEKYNKINYLKMFFRIIFCINHEICAKVIQTFAHKLIRI